MAATLSTITATLLLLLAVGLGLLFLARRHRLAFRVGVRNVLRARRRTLLVVAGLLVATTIISGSLVVGDTIDTLAVHYTVLAVGTTDQVIGNQSPSGGYAYFPYSVYTSVSAATTGDPSIAGLAPEVVGRVSVMDRTSGVPQPNLYLIGGNANQTAQLGSFVATDGATVQGPAPGTALLDVLAAGELNASAGDSVLLYGATAHPLPLTVQAVVQDNVRGAFPTGGIGDFGSVFVNLSTAQGLVEEPGAINFLAVTDTGSQADRLAQADAVSASLNATLAAIPAAAGLSSQPLFKNALTQEERTGSGVTTLFLVLGLFSIVAGALLIVGIFLLLAEERKGEMGVMRAVGLPARELLYAFIFEGAIYAAGSAAAGTALGVAVGYGLTYAFGILIATPGLGPTALLDSFTISSTSLVLSYAAGFLLTLITVLIASRRASRLNIVRAIHDLPEPDPQVRVYTYAALAGAAALVVGVLLYAGTYSGTSDLSDPLIGGALAISGAGLVASRFLKNRLVFTAVAVALLVWIGYAPLHSALLGSSHGGGIYAVFTEGILLVSGAVLLYAFNSASIANALTRLAGGRHRRAPVARVGLAHPGRRPARATISLAIFALVAFTLVAIAGVGSSLDASLGAVVANESGGYTFIAYSAAPIPTLPQLVAANATVAPLFREVVPLASTGVAVTVNGSTAPAYADTVYAGPPGEPASSDFYTTNAYTYSATLHGLSAGAVRAQLASDPGVAIVDESYSTTANNLAGAPPAGHPTVDPGARLTLTNPANGRAVTVTVIGVMTQSALSGVFVGPATGTALGATDQKIFLLGLAPGVSAAHAALRAKQAFFPYGLVLVNVENAVATSIATTEGEIGLLQIFVALGLAVGIAAMGIVALRAVVERRREIGMLRASGFTSGMVVRAFVLEYSFITLAGLLVGTVLGLLLVWNLTHSPAGTAASVSVFAVPWTNLALILVGTYGLSMLAVAGPTRAAAHLSPAVAVRSTE